MREELEVLLFAVHTLPFASTATPVGPVSPSSDTFPTNEPLVRRWPTFGVPKSEWATQTLPLASTATPWAVERPWE